MSFDKWTRRGVLLSGGAVLLFPLKPALARTAEQRVANAIDLIFPDRTSAARLGGWLMERGLLPHSRVEYAGRVDASLALQNWHLAGRDPSVLRERLSDRIADDYARGHVTKAEGCYFADMEKDLCGVAFLAEQS